MREEENYKEELENEKERLKELNEKGCSALSDFDISMAIGTGSKPSSALRTAKRLVEAHISYYENKIREQFKGQTTLEAFK